MRRVHDRIPSWDESQVIGLISDTHGLIRPEALTALGGASLLIHAGDIGDPSVLRTLSSIARLLPIRGNNDRDAWAHHLPDVRTIEIAGMTLAVVHDLASLPSSVQSSVIIAGHSHRPTIAYRDETLIVNPGSAGPRRFALPVSVARLQIAAGVPIAELVELDVSTPSSSSSPSSQTGRRRVRR